LTGRLGGSFSLGCRFAAAAHAGEREEHDREHCEAFPRAGHGLRSREARGRRVNDGDGAMPCGPEARNSSVGLITRRYQSR
jgi:hypothetical protein